MPRKPGLPAIVTEPRPPRRLPRRSAPPAAVHAQSSAPAPASLPPPSLPPPTAPSAPPVITRVSRRMSPTNRSKSPPKSSSKVIRVTDSSPKRCVVVSENINTERLKMARDEAERAMKVGHHVLHVSMNEKSKTMLTTVGS